MFWCPLSGKRMKTETGLTSTSHTIDDGLVFIYKVRRDPAFTKDFFYSETYSQVHQLPGLEAQGLVLSTTPPFSTVPFLQCL